MKRLLIITVLSIALLFSCTKPLDSIVILNVKDKNVETSITTTTVINDDSTFELTDIDTSTPISSDIDVGGHNVIILNKSSKKIHLSDECSYAKKILESNKKVAPYADLASYVQAGYKICSYCEKHY